MDGLIEGMFSVQEYVSSHRADAWLAARRAGAKGAHDHCLEALHLCFECAILSFIVKY